MIKLEKGNLEFKGSFEDLIMEYFFITNKLYETLSKNVNEEEVREMMKFSFNLALDDDTSEEEPENDEKSEDDEELDMDKVIKKMKSNGASDGAIGLAMLLKYILGGEEK